MFVIPDKQTIAMTDVKCEAAFHNDCDESLTKS